MIVVSINCTCNIVVKEIDLLLQKTKLKLLVNISVAVVPSKKLWKWSDRFVVKLRRSFSKKKSSIDDQRSTQRNKDTRCPTRGHSGLFTIAISTRAANKMEHRTRNVAWRDEMIVFLLAVVARCKPGIPCISAGL